MEATNPMWQAILNSHHGPLISALNRGDANGIEKVFNNLGWGCHGIENPEIVAWGSSECNKYMSWLAQSVGVEPCGNPQHPVPGNRSDYKTILENVIGLKFDPPNCFQYDCTKGIPARFVYSFRSGFTIKQLLKRTPNSLLEIGAGMGWMGYVAWQWKCKYTVIDLPSIDVMGATFMSKVCGPEKVWLYGEPENLDASCRFFPSTHFEGARGKYEVIFNHDSFPEMTDKSRKEYIGLIRDCLSDDGIFLSINHEYASRVYDSAKELHLVSRNPFMMREGYIEEVYTK